MALLHAPVPPHGGDKGAKGGLGSFDLDHLQACLQAIADMGPQQQIIAVDLVHHWHFFLSYK